MFQPRIPVNPLPTGLVTPLAQPTVTTDIAPHHTADVAPCNHHHAPAAPALVPAPSSTVRLTPASLAVVVAGGVGAVLVVGTVLVSMLLAVAVSAVSVAVCAVVLRSLLNGQRRHR
ncbi:SpdD-like protein [Streptomyces sp. NPDC020472]|uniref:SpdD-like protein n=1 Tax=Streptomyces sp. NPDC020472 TaxID=3365075 RepID=UPI0037BDED82